MMSDCRWIWPRDRREPNLHLLFRRDLDIAVEGDLRIDLAVESAAEIWVDQVRIGRTAANSYPGQHYVETFTVPVATGRRRLAVVVRYIGIPGTSSIPKDPGLLARVTLPDGTIVPSDATWAWRDLDAWRGRLRRSEWFNLDLIEICDRRRLPVGFPCVEDLGGFAIPEVLPSPGVRFTGLEPRPFPKPVDTGPVALDLVRSGRVVDRSNDHEIPAQAMSHEAITEAPVDWDGRTLALPAAETGMAWTAVFALDGYRNARAVLQVRAPAGTIIDLAWCERLGDQGHLDVRTTRVHSADRFICAGGPETIEPEDWICGRFVQVTVRGHAADARIGLAVRGEAYPLHRRLELTTSDPVLDRIIAISLNAVERCMHDNIMDCPWRERRQWIGDVQRIALVSHLAHGDGALIRAVLRQHVHLQEPSGRMWICVPLWEEYPTQNMEWLRAVLDYQEATGDATLLDEVAPNAEALHRWFRTQIRDGLLHITAANVMNWMDNPLSRLRPHQFRTPFLAINLRYLRFLDDLVPVYLRLGRDPACLALEREDLCRTIAERFRDPGTGLLRDCVDPDLPLTISEMGQALAVCTGLADGTTWDRFNTWRSTAGDAAIPASPFGKHHVHEALAVLGRPEAIIADIRTHWGPMVAAGADTTWEGFDGKASHCHGWAGIPVHSLCTLILGLRPRPGSARRSLAGLELQATIGA